MIPSFGKHACIFELIFISLAAYSERTPIKGTTLLNDHFQISRGCSVNMGTTVVIKRGVMKTDKFL